MIDSNIIFTVSIIGIIAFTAGVLLAFYIGKGVGYAQGESFARKLYLLQKNTAEYEKSLQQVVSNYTTLAESLAKSYEDGRNN